MGPTIPIQMVVSAQQNVLKKFQTQLPPPLISNLLVTGKFTGLVKGHGTFIKHKVNIVERKGEMVIRWIKCLLNGHGIWDPFFFYSHQNLRIDDHLVVGLKTKNKKKNC